MPSDSSENTDSSRRPKIVVDSVHGDICPSLDEWKVIDTPSFQRLRKLKQLQMAHLVYPNATHTRFAHSLGVLKVMQRILERVGASPDQKEDLRLAALMHDIGHYPYSHLLEGVDRVILTEEHLGMEGPRSPLGARPTYPDHEEVGREILLNQPDLSGILGRERAERVGHIFARTKVADQQLSKLIHSSLDMDRLDYLIRDSQATGVPYGLVDIHYLLNHLKQSRMGVIGITHKAVAAAEHMLLARSFLFRVVCQHKTIYGFEEAARQVLRRLRDRAQDGGEGYGVPRDGDAILEIARGNRLHTFTDAFLDNIFIQAASDSESDPIIKILASAIISRHPPRLIWEKRTFRERDDEDYRSDDHLFQLNCQHHLKQLVHQKGLLPGQFLICELKPIGFESRGPRLSMDAARQVLEESDREEMLRVFPSHDADEPVPIVELRHSLLHQIGSHVFRTYRLYYVSAGEEQDTSIPELKEAVKGWG